MALTLQLQQVSGPLCWTHSRRQGVSVLERLPHLPSWSPKVGTQLSQRFLLAPPQCLVVSWGFSA